MAGRAIDGDEITSLKEGRRYSPQVHGDEGLAKPSLANTEYGLDETKYQMHKRWEAYGSNTYPKKVTKCFWSFVWDACEDKNFIIPMMCVVVFLATGIGIEGIIIGVALLLVIVVTAVRKYKQGLEFQNLNAQMENIKLEVSRAGRRRTVPVVGDTVPFSIGGQAPADGVLVEGHSLSTDESTVTEESLAVKKDKSRPFLPLRCKAQDGGGPCHWTLKNLVNFDMKRTTNKQLLSLFYICFNMIRDAHAQDQLTENGKPVDPKVWDISDCAKVAMAILAVSIGGVGVAVWKMYNRRPTFTEDDINEGLSSWPAVPRRSDATFEILPLIECWSDEE